MQVLFLLLNSRILKVNELFVSLASISPIVHFLYCFLMPYLSFNICVKESFNFGVLCFACMKNKNPIAQCIDRFFFFFLIVYLSLMVVRLNLKVYSSF